MLLRSFQRLISLREFGLSRGLPAAWQAAILHSAAAPAPTDPPPLEPPPADSDSAVDLDSPLLPPPPEHQRLLQVAVVGAPNAGKSTLTNALVGSKVSAVSAKTNTTERSALGAMTVGDAQVVLFDTPGVVASRHYRGPVHTRRVQSAWRVARDADLLLFLVDAARQLERPDPRVEQVVADYGERVRESQHAAAEAAAAKAAALAAPAAERETAPPGEPRTRPQAGQPEGLETEQQAAPAVPGAAWPPALLLLNKVDAVSRDDRPHLLPLAERFSGLAPFEDVFYISAKHGQGMQQLRELLLSRATPGEWTLPDPQAATDRSDTELALEVVREKLFQRLYRELPYRLQLRPVSLAQLRDGSLRVEQEIVAPSQGARAIVVGHGGSVVGAVGADARAELAALWGRPVHLVLKVKVAGKRSL